MVRACRHAYVFAVREREVAAGRVRAQPVECVAVVWRTTGGAARVRCACAVGVVAFALRQFALQLGAVRVLAGASLSPQYSNMVLSIGDGELWIQCLVRSFCSEG
eukprot:7038258-Prymnesium_polylepis.1